MTILRNPGRSLVKIASMSRGELRTRVAQAVAQRIDLLRYRLGREPAVPTGVDRGTATPRFFFASADVPELIALLRSRLPAECQRIVERADLARRHRFDLLGYEALSFGEPIDWHLDPVSGRKSPLRPWYKVPFLDFARVGDSKVTWELNRHQHFVTLAKAYRLTDDPAYGDEIASQWHLWWAGNPYPMGTNWASALEVAFRSISWLWVKYLLAGSPALPAPLSEDIDRGLALSGRHLATHLSTYFSANTHLLGEAVALFFIGLLMPELTAARRWRRQGWEIVLDQSRRQFHEDGLHFERSLYYHVYALDFLLHARILAHRNEVRAPELDEALNRQLDVLRDLSISGTVFRFGDDDGGRLFDGSRNRGEHLLDPLVTGAALFDRRDLVAAARGLREETVWLLGVEGARRLDGTEPQSSGAASVEFAARESASREFAASEMYLMAAGEPLPWQALIGPGRRPGLAGGHAHADLLGLQMMVGGRNVLSDSGTFVYVDADGLRDDFRGTAAHNTVEVDHRSQADPSGPFAWRTPPKSSTDLWVSAADFDLFRGHHEGYSRPQAPLLHGRWVFNLKSSFVFVRDTVDGRGTAQVDVRWHLAAEAALQRAGEHAYTASISGDPVLALLTAEDHGWSARVERGWTSPVYGKKESRSVLRFSRGAALPAEFVTLLNPLCGSRRRSAGGIVAPGALRRLGPRRAGTGDNVVGYAFDEAGTTHFLFFSEGGAEWQISDWRSDAEFLYGAVASEAPKLLQVLAVGGRHVYFGREHHAAPPAAGSCWTWRA